LRGKWCEFLALDRHRRGTSHAARRRIRATRRAANGFRLALTPPSAVGFGFERTIALQNARVFPRGRSRLSAGALRLVTFVPGALFFSRALRRGTLRRGTLCQGTLVPGALLLPGALPPGEFLSGPRLHGLILRGTLHPRALLPAQFFPGPLLAGTLFLGALLLGAFCCGLHLPGVLLPGPFLPGALVPGTLLLPEDLPGILGGHRSGARYQAAKEQGRED
jgi:hypothetical protein